MSTRSKTEMAVVVIVACICLSCSKSGQKNAFKQGQNADNCSQLIDEWEWRDPLPSGNNLWDVAYGNGQFVAVADGGVIFTSPDGSDWKRRNLCTFNNFHAIVYAAGQFVAVGDSGTIFTSKDGRSWFSRRSGAMV